MSSDSESSSDALSAGEFMARADSYLAANITYCGGPRGGQDETTCGEGICQQPMGPWNNYRSDCSGFVSYVWQIPSDPDTATYSYDQSGSMGWSTIGIDQLRAGDALVAQGHIKLFASFSGSSAALVYEEYDCNLIAHKEVQGFSRSGNRIWFMGDDRAYHAIRRNGLSTPTPQVPTRAIEVAFQANTGSLWTVGSAGERNWNLGMMAGTDPSIAALEDGGYEVAFQSNNGDLWTVGSAGNRNWGLGMMRSSNPSITALKGGGYQVAFQANNGDLWTVGSAGNRHWDLGMMRDSSPSIAGLQGGGFEVAFQAGNGDLWTAGDAGMRHWELGMMAGTSPSIAGLAGGGFEVAFQANNGDLWTAGDAGMRHWALGMMRGSSPAIQSLPGNRYQIVFEANTAELWKANDDEQTPMELGMADGTSPAGT